MFGELTYIYLGTADFERDVSYYRDVLGAELVWSHAKFGARVAGFRPGGGPMVLLADHRPAPSAMLIYAVEDLDATVQALEARGFKPIGPSFEVPDGPVVRFDDPSGNPFALIQLDRPGVLEP